MLGRAGIFLAIVASVVAQDFPFRDPTLSIEERVDDLVSRLTLDDIYPQLSHGGTGSNGPAPGIESLGIGPYSWNTECLHGAGSTHSVKSGQTTSFPQALGLAAAFDTDVIFRMANATSHEVRGRYNDFQQEGLYGDHRGLSCFAPVINIMRHPLWGRNQETYGEDPVLSGTLSAAYVRGLQGDHPRFVRANAGCKHFNVHAGPETIPVSRFDFDAVLSERDWRLTFQPAFKECVQAGSLNLMCSYNRINGVPACANRHLLTELAREEWGFKGYVISDQDAIENIITWHHVYDNPVDCAAACVNAGTNLDLCTNNPNNVYTHLPEAVEQGLVTEDTLRELIRQLFYVRLRLGEFDPPADNPYNSLDNSTVQSAEHQALALEIALKTIVLLKNDGVLPLSDGQYPTIAVVGPFANNAQTLSGDYAPQVNEDIWVTPYEGLQKANATIKLGQGCDQTGCNSYNAFEVVEAVTGADLVIITAGTGDDIESEGLDRGDMDFPGRQRTLISDAIAAAAGKPVILVLFNAGPVRLDDELLASSNAILELFFPNQAGGDALRASLFNEGDMSSPAGRLPYTWVKDLSQALDITNYTMVGRTYRYWDWDSDPTFPFGYGLSYTTFEYSNLVAPASVVAGQDVEFTVTVANVGENHADEVVQAYISWNDATVEMPRLQLVNFTRVHVHPGESADVQLSVRSDRLAIWDDDDGFVISPGQFTLYVGGQQPNQNVNVGSNVLSQDFAVTAS